MIGLYYGHNGRGELAPCSFVLTDGARDLLFDIDWNFPGLARCLGYQPCRRCNETDGTDDCRHRTHSDMIAGAFDYLYARRDRRYREHGVIGRQLAEYFH